MTVASARRFDLLEAPRAMTSRVGRIRGGKIVLRDPLQVDTLCVHQTAVEFGASRWAVLKAGGDRELAIAHRSLALPYHVMSFDGFYSLTCPVNWYTHHGNAWNARSVGLGIDGFYPGLAMRRRAKHTVLTRRRIDSARCAVDAVLTSAGGHGQCINRVVAHRQSNAKKPSDPGEEIWRDFVEAVLVAEFGLIPVYDEAPGGLPIPAAWADSASAPYR